MTCEHTYRKDRGGPHDDEVMRCAKCGAYQPPAPIPSRWPTITVPAISIHHLKGSTVDWIRGMEKQKSLDFMCAIHNNNLFMIYPDSEDHLEALPEDLRNVFKASTHFTSHGWFLLDVDGDEVPGLPLYKD